MDTFNKLWRLLNTCEDYARGGSPRPHGNPPPSPYAERTNLPASAQPDPAQPDPAQTRQKVRPSAGIAGGGGLEGDSKEQRWTQLRALAAEVEQCRRCSLAVSRKKTVPGMGALDPQVMIIGEGPGSREDQTGVPFVGPAGQYLDKWLAAIQLDRNENCYIGNIVKCRPPGNRDPLPEESGACLPYLRRQIRILRPGAILTLGRTAVQNLLGVEESLGRLRGQVYEFEGIPVFPTYHPSGVLRNPSYRRPVWEDLKVLRGWLEEHGLR